MYRWLAKDLFAAWIVGAGYQGVAHRLEGRAAPGSPAEVPDPATVARGVKDVAVGAREQARTEEFGSLVRSGAALVLFFWDKAAEGMSASFAPGAPRPGRPARGVDEVTVREAVGRMRTVVEEAASVAVGASGVVERESGRRVSPAAGPGPAVPEVPADAGFESPGRNSR